MKQKQSRWGVLPGPLFSGADAGVGELWEHNPCWSCGQLCNNGSHSRITTVSGLWLATTLPALFKVTVLGDTLISFYTEVLHWVPWGLVCWAGAPRWVECTWELLKAAVPGWVPKYSSKNYSLYSVSTLAILLIFVWWKWSYIPYPCPLKIHSLRNNMRVVPKKCMWAVAWVMNWTVVSFIFFPIKHYS